MIESLTVKHHSDVVVNLVWQNGQVATQTINAEYNVFFGLNDIVVTHNKNQVIEPVEGRLIVTCLITNNDITGVVLNAEGYKITAINSDGRISVHELPDNSKSSEDEIGNNHTTIEERWTRNNHP